MQDVIIDASCLLNLVATRRELEIARALDWHLITPEMAFDQVRYLRTPPDAEGERRTVPADLGPLCAADLLARRSLTEDWMDAFVQCAIELDDADAACAALATTLRLPLVADDRKLRRVARGRDGDLVLIGTLDFLVSARDALAWDEAEAARVLFDLRWRGNFVPRPDDPHAEWFRLLMSYRDVR